MAFLLDVLPDLFSSPLIKDVFGGSLAYELADSFLGKNSDADRKGHAIANTVNTFGEHIAKSISSRKTRRMGDTSMTTNYINEPVLNKRANPYELTYIPQIQKYMRY